MQKFKIGILLIILAACTTGPQETARPSSTAAENIATATPISTITPSPTPGDTATPIPTEGPPPIIDVCPEIENGMPEGVEVEGQLVLSPMNQLHPYLLEPITRKTKVLPYTDTEGYFSVDLAVSPSREFMAYFAQSGTPSRLVVSGARGEIIYVRYVNKDTEWLHVDSWINDQTLMLDKPKSIPEHEITLAKPLPVTFLNPFTGDTWDIEPNLPGIQGLDGILTWDNYGLSSAAYDPTLQLVAYAGRDPENRQAIVLWDIESRQEITHIQAPIGYSPGPVWFPDGSRFVTVSLAKPPKAHSKWTYEEAYSEELFNVARSGEIARITYLTNQFDEVEILNASWSPDGKQIAFYLRIGPDDGLGDERNYWRLAVVDLSTKQVTRYCFHGGAFETRIFWSPDGNQLLATVLDFEETVQTYRNIYDTVLVDLRTPDLIYKIADETVPLGWMVDAP